MVDAKGQEVFRVYDELRRLTAVELRPSQGALADDIITLGYDAVGNLTAANDNDSDLAFTYDDANRRLTAVTGPIGLLPQVTLTSAYNVLGERTGLTDSLGGSTGFTYDTAGRLTGIEIDPATVIALAYDASGRMTQIAYPNGVSGDASYDTAGRLQDLAHSLGGLDLTAYAYGYDAVGQVTSVAEPAQTRNFSYDPLRQLTAGGTTAVPESYDYDAAGNRTTSHLSAAHSHDAANRLLEDDQACYGYDQNGNRITKTEKLAGACTGAVTAYGYDILNRLVRIDFPDATAATYAYDALGRRIQKDVEGTVTKYLYDGEDIALEFDGADLLQARYRHGDQRDQALAMERGGQQHYLHADRRGSLRLVSDAAGAVLNSTDYDAYGNFETRIETVATPYGFTGREHDPESGLFYYRARTYDPATGRFLQEDPIGFVSGDLNLYRYVFNNPLVFRDPMGLVIVTVEFEITIPAMGESLAVGVGVSFPVPYIDPSADIDVGVYGEAGTDDFNDPSQQQGNRVKKS